jgi:Zn-dependent peptidase ImmA (M78 family)
MSGNGWRTDPVKWRKDVLKLSVSELLPAADVLTACANATGIRWTSVTHGDPLLAGAQAVLDREASVIWIDRTIPDSRAFGILAHEYAHCVLHSRRFEEPGLVLYGDELGFDQSPDLDGYSGAQYSERMADKWAAGLLLPRDALRGALAVPRASAALIAASTGLPQQYVTARVLAAILYSEIDNNPHLNFPELTQLQQEAASAEHGPFTCIGKGKAGKNATLIERCRVLTQERATPIDEIIIITPRKSGVRRLQSLFKSQLTLSDLDFNVPRVCTLDSLCYEMLRRYATKVGLNDNWRVAVTGETENSDSKGLLSFDKVVGDILILFNQFPEIEAEISSLYKSVLVDSLDEFDALRLDIISKLASANLRGFWATAKCDIPFHERLTLLFPDSKIVQLDAISDGLADAKKRRKISVTLAVAPDDKSEVSAICSMIRSNVERGIPLQEQAVFCRSWADTGRFHAALKREGLIHSELLWIDSPPVKDLICLLQFVGNHASSKRNRIERRIKRLFSEPEIQKSELTRLQRLQSPTSVLKEYLAGQCGYLFGRTDACFDSTKQRDSAAVRELLELVANHEEKCKRELLAPEMPGGGFEDGVGLYQQVMCDLLAEFASPSTGGRWVLPSYYSGLDEITVLRLGSGHDSAYGASFIPSNTSDFDLIAQYIESTRYVESTRGHVIVSACAGNEFDVSKIIGELSRRLGQNQSDIVRWPIVREESTPKHAGSIKEARTPKPNYSAQDLDIFNECPRRYFYKTDGEKNEPVDANSSKIELANCVVALSPGVQDKKPEAGSRISKWFRDIFADNMEKSPQLAPGQSLRYELAADSIQRGDFTPNPRSPDLCRTCEYRWVCPE